MSGFLGMSVPTVVVYLLGFPGALIMEILFFRSKFWKNIMAEYSEWNDDEDIEKKK